MKTLAKNSRKLEIAISIGDINGIGLEIALLAHKSIAKHCVAYYFIHESLLNKALKLLKMKKPKDFFAISFQNIETFKGQKNENLMAENLAIKNESLAIRNDKKFTKNAKFDIKKREFFVDLGEKVNENFNIKAGQIDTNAGKYSFLSFKAAVRFVELGFADALITLPIHKKAWNDAGVGFKGHTQALSAFFNTQAIMMMGCKRLFIGLFTEHIALNAVSKMIKAPKLCEFLLNFYENTRFKKIGVLSFNPHASDFGTIGGAEEREISRAIRLCNVILSLKFTLLGQEWLEKQKIKTENLLKRLLRDERLLENLEKSSFIRYFYHPNPLVADTAFTSKALKHCNRLVSMSHDVALAPLKALFFNECINVSLNLPIIRTSVGHGTAFDKAYKDTKISTKSYKNAVLFALKLAKKRKNSESLG